MLRQRESKKGNVEKLGVAGEEGRAENEYRVVGWDQHEKGLIHSTEDMDLCWAISSALRSLNSGAPSRR